MDRTIEVKVNGNYLIKDNDFAGVQGESNVTYLRIMFDEGWDGYAKKVTFWNAYGENPVERTLTADLLENLTDSIRTYLCPIPGEALAEAGRCTFVIDGYADGKRQRSLEDTLKVRGASVATSAGEPADPTPTQAEQLQGQIDAMLPAIQAEAKTASDAAASAKESAEAAAISEGNASTYAGEAKTGAETATQAASEAVAAKDSAAQSAAEAAQSANEAKSAASAAAESAGKAKASETAAEAYAEDAKTSARAAATSEKNAKISETNASSSATAAGTSATNAKASETAAKTAQNAAESAKATAESKAASASESAQNAEQSESNAATSATNAATSETNANTSANAAATSASDAATSKSEAATSAQEASQSAAQASASASTAASHEAGAKAAREGVEAAQAATEAAQAKADASASSAAISASNAAKSESAAATSANNASASEANASSSASAAASAASSAESSKSDAAKSATAAAQSATSAAGSATTAGNASTVAQSAQAAAEASKNAAANSASAAATSEANAKAAQAAAEQARDEAAEIVGGDFATNSGAQAMADAAEAAANQYTDQKVAAIKVPVTSVNSKTGDVVLSASDVGAPTVAEAQGYASTAEKNAKTAAQGYADSAKSAANKYTDEKVGAVDVSSQINAHNTATDSHADIRQAVSNAASAASTAQSTADTARSNAATAQAAAEAAQATADGKEASGTAASAVSAHNTSASAHADIRQAVSSAAAAAATAQNTADGKEAAGTAASVVSTHNADTTAHNDIRTAASNAASAASAAQSAADRAASAAASAQQTANAAQSAAKSKAPATHASQHASGGSDPITPASIGAASVKELEAAAKSAPYVVDGYGNLYRLDVDTSVQTAPYFMKYDSTNGHNNVFYTTDNYIYWIHVSTSSGSSENVLKVYTRDGSTLVKTVSLGSNVYGSYFWPYYCSDDAISFRYYASGYKDAEVFWKEERVLPIDYYRLAHYDPYTKDAVMYYVSGTNLYVKYYNAGTAKESTKSYSSAWSNYNKYQAFATKDYLYCNYNSKFKKIAFATGNETDLFDIDEITTGSSSSTGYSSPDIFYVTENKAFFAYDYQSGRRGGYIELDLKTDTATVRLATDTTFRMKNYMCHDEYGNSYYQGTLDGNGNGTEGWFKVDKDFNIIATATGPSSYARSSIYGQYPKVVCRKYCGTRRLDDLSTIIVRKKVSDTNTLSASYASHLFHSTPSTKQLLMDSSESNKYALLHDIEKELFEPSAITGLEKVGEI